MNIINLETSKKKLVVYKETINEKVTWAQMTSVVWTLFQWLNIEVLAMVREKQVAKHLADCGDTVQIAVNM